MDVHAGNIIHSESGLRLIDWEYAGDGDIALELAAVWIASRAPPAGGGVCPAGGHRRAAALAAGCTLAPVGTAADGGLV
jgi:aminoglycoside phosphotransferase (APT) family kinase protein